MKKYMFFIAVLSFLSVGKISAQDDLIDPQIKNGVTYWYGKPAKKAVDSSELIFEGRVLTDSTYFRKGGLYTAHKVLVLKEFKGDFKSDTVIVVHLGGKEGKIKVEGRLSSHVSKDDEAVFLVNSRWGYYLVGYGFDVSFIPICNRKDIVKEVYEPIEAVTGKKYVDVHPNKCAEWQAPKKSVDPNCPPPCFEH
jgi:hypothetical protein